MKMLWSMLRGKIRRDNRGMTFVEVLCAVAILGLVASTIGTVIVMSTRTYRKGISETGIQQEAQLAANNIGNLVKDACSVRYAAAGAQYLENGETLMVKADGATPLENETGFTDLSIITNEKIQYTITYDDTNSALRYEEFDVGSATPKRPAEIIADNVTAFSADTTDFKKSKTIKLNMTVHDDATNREIPMEYTMTSRNDAMDGFEYVSSALSVVIAFPDAEVVLVPGETYQIPLLVSGTLSEGLEWESTGALTGGALTADYAEVTVPKDIDSSVISETIKVRTKDKNADSTPKSTASCKVLIRRVTKVEVSHAVDTAHADGHMLEAAGAEYTFSATVAGYELAKRPSYGFDNNYKTAQAMVWSCVFDLNGTQTAYDWTADSSSGHWTFINPDFVTSPFSDYFEVLENKEDEIFPSFKIKLKKAMPSNFKLTVRATSKHALGVNKADSDYGDKDNAYYYGEDTIEPRETKMDQGLTITLEPHESGKVAVGMKGGISSNVTFEFHDASDEGEGKTRAKYIAAEDKVEITLGKDEVGSGPTGAEPYTFTVDVKADGVVKTTIKVYVCRIDTISIAVIDNYHEKKNDGKPDDHATYDFRARFNTDTASLEDMQPVTKNLIRYKADGTPDEEILKKTLSSKITWELIDHNANGKVVHTDYAICEAGVGEKGKIVVKNKEDSFKSADGKATFKVVEVKPARIEKDSGGNWIIKQLPEVDIAPSTMPKDYELKVTIRSLHPSGKVDGGTYNQTGKAYIDTNVEASASVTGNMSVSAPADLVIVEPGQGTNEEAQSDIEMVIPLKVTASAYKMNVTLKEKSEDGTQLCAYKSGNPYKAENASSANEGKYTWYLGLNIDAKERGNNLGRIKVHVDALDTKDNVVASTDFELGVRRVDEIGVRVEDNKKISTVNKAGQTMTLEALPCAVPIPGANFKTTEFYAIQKDESGKVCRWEQNGHGGYKDPYKMEWRMVIDGKEKPLGDWKDYIETVSSDKTVPDDKKAVVSFKLKKALPIGTKIRAYSLHARGNNGKESTDSAYVKYNKSGKEYEKDVYGELEIKNSLLDIGMMRGTEAALNMGVAQQPISNEIANQGGQQRGFLRYKEYGSDKWLCGYRKVTDNSPVPAQLTSGDMWQFKPDRDYEIEVITAVYSTQTMKLYWPQDEALLAPGAGWTEAGFTKGWTDSKVTPEEEYKRSYYIGKVTLAVDGTSSLSGNTGNQNLGLTDQSSGFEPYSEANPLKIKLSEVRGMELKYDLKYFHLGNGQSKTNAKLKKFNGSQWVDATLEERNRFNIQEQTRFIKMDNIGGAVKGRYALCVNLDDQDTTSIDTTQSPYDQLLNPKAVKNLTTMQLGDWSTGEGILYFDVE